MEIFTLQIKSYLSSWGNQATMFFPLWNKTEPVVLCHAKFLCFSKAWQPTEDSVKCPFPSQEISYLQSQSWFLLLYFQLKNLTVLHPKDTERYQWRIWCWNLSQSLTSKCIRNYYKSASYKQLTTTSWEVKAFLLIKHLQRHKTFTLSQGVSQQF